MRTAGYGQFVGSGLDHSGGLAGRHAPSHTPPHVGAGHARPGGVRRTGVCGITCGPGMPGPYREAAELMQVCPESPTGGSRPSPTNRRERVPYGERHTAPHTSARRGRACPARRCTVDGCLRDNLRAGHARPLPRGGRIDASLPGKSPREGQDPPQRTDVNIRRTDKRTTTKPPHHNARCGGS